MLRGSSELLQRSARHLVPLIETIAEVPPEVWDLPYRDPGDVGSSVETGSGSWHALQDAIFAACDRMVGVG